MSSLKTFIQCSKKISYSNYQELEEQINNLKSSSEFPISISSTTPKWTDTNNWCLVNYWEEILN